MQVACPKCSTGIPIDSEAADAKGSVRLQCGNCGARVLVKVNRPSLKLNPSIPATADKLPAVRLPRDTGSSPPVAPPEEAPPAPDGRWQLIVRWLDPQKLAWFRKDLMTLDRFKASPRQLDQLLAELPYELDDLDPKDATFLEGRLRRLVAEVELRQLGGHPEVDDEPSEIFDLNGEDNAGAPAFSGGGGASEEENPFLTPRKPAPAIERLPPVPKAPVTDSASITGDGQLPMATMDFGDIVPMYSVEAIPEIKRFLGLVSAQVIVTEDELRERGGGERQEAIHVAMVRAKRILSSEAAGLAADAVVGLRISQGVLPGTAGQQGWLLLMQGTAVEF